MEAKQMTQEQVAEALEIFEALTSFSAYAMRKADAAVLNAIKARAAKLVSEVK